MSLNVKHVQSYVYHYHYFVCDLPYVYLFCGLLKRRAFERFNQNSRAGAECNF